MKITLPTFNTFTLKATILTLLLIVAFTFTQAQTCGCDHVINPPADRITPLFVDGELLGVKPGQTICLNKGFYLQIRFIRLTGAPGNPITIKNCGGLVEIGDSTNYGRWYAADIVSSKYIRFTGSGDPANKYGIKLGKSGDSGLKIGASTDTEIDHIEIGNTNFAGILAKSDFGGNPPAGAMEMNNVNIHDNYVHDTRGEGMYIGETKTPGQDFRHLHVWNNIVTRAGFELIQVSNVVEDAQVHNNVMYQGGMRNVLYQNKGFQIGDNSVGRYYNNILIGSSSNLMIIMGSGDIDIYNNYLASSKSDPAFFIDNRVVNIPSAPINIYKNYLMDVNEKFAFFSVFNEKNPVRILKNTFEGKNDVLLLGSEAGPNVKAFVNSNEIIERIQFVDIENDNFKLMPGSPYQDMGLQEDVSNLNKRPFVALIPDQVLDYETFGKVPVSATDPDGDGMKLEAFNLPPFVSFKDYGNGSGMFYLTPQANDIGIYYKVRVRVSDRKGGMNTQNFTIKVLDRYAFIATDSLLHENNYPSNTLDSNLTTRWAATDSTGKWIKYDLREDKLVTSVNVAFHNGISTVYPFDIEVSENDSSWVRVFSGTSSGSTADFETFSFDEVKARYLRIIDTGNSSNLYNEVVINCITAPQFHRFHPTADVYVEEKTVYDNKILRAKDSNIKSFIRFKVSELDVQKSPVISARLKLKAMGSALGSLNIYLGDDSHWSETAYRQFDLPKPVRILDTLATDFIAGDVYELNVLSAIPDKGYYNFILIVEDSRRGVSFSSREGEFQPELEIQTLRSAEPQSQNDTARTSNTEGRSGAASSENSFNDMRLYPNPAKDKITLDLGVEQSAFVMVEICDQVGSTFYTKNLENSPQLIDLDLNIPGMAPGLYFVKVKQGSGPVKILRLVKN